MDPRGGRRESGILREAASWPWQVGDGMQPGSGAMGPRQLSCWRRPTASRVSVVSRELGTSGQGKAGVSLGAAGVGRGAGPGAGALAARRRRAYQVVLNLDVPGRSTSNKR